MVILRREREREREREHICVMRYSPGFQVTRCSASELFSLRFHTSYFVKHRSMECGTIGLGLFCVWKVCKRW